MSVTPPRHHGHMTRGTTSDITSAQPPDSPPVQLAIEGLDTLLLLPSKRVPATLRLSAETRRRGLEHIARLRAELNSRRTSGTTSGANAA